MSLHVYEHKGVRLYYELPYEGYNYVKDCIKDLYEHMGHRGEVSSRHINQLLAGIKITTVDFNGGFSK